MRVIDYLRLGILLLLASVCGGAIGAGLAGKSAQASGVIADFDSITAKKITVVGQDGSFLEIDNNSLKIRTGGFSHASLTRDGIAFLQKDSQAELSPMGIRLSKERRGPVIGYGTFEIKFSDNAEPFLSLNDPGASWVTLQVSGLNFVHHGLGESGFYSAKGASITRKQGEIRMGAFSDGASYIHLYDKDGKLRAALGFAELVQPKTEARFQRPISSLVLFNQEGRVLWSAP